MDKQTDGWTNRQTDVQTDRQMDKQRDGWTNRQTDVQTDRLGVPFLRRYFRSESEKVCVCVFLSLAHSVIG